MDYFVYLLFRAFTALVLSLPLIVVYRLGQTLGFIGWLVFVPYRRLVVANMTIAYGASKSPAEIRRLARQHFLTLGANLPRRDGRITREHLVGADARPT